MQYTRTLYHPHNFSVNLKLFQKIRFIFFKVTRRVRLVSVHLQARVRAPLISAHANRQGRAGALGQGYTSDCRVEPTNVQRKKMTRG